MSKHIKEYEVTKTILRLEDCHVWMDYYAGDDFLCSQRLTGLESSIHMGIMAGGQ